MVTYIKICYNSYMGATLEGGSGGPIIGQLNSCSYRNPYGKSVRKGGLSMMTVDLFIGILSLCIGCFSLGYMLGKSSHRKSR